MKRFILICLCLLSAATYASTRELTLQDAIYLAVRQNPNVQNAQLAHVLQTYAVEIQRWQFEPHYSFQATRTTNKNYSVTNGNYVTENSTGAQVGMNLLTPIGTNIAIKENNNITNNYNPGLSVQIEQPLLRGFGKAIVEAALNDALDNEKISRLQVEGVLRETVTSVIKAYLDVLSAQGTLAIDQKDYERAQLTVKQTQLFIKAGHKAGVELIGVQAAAANAQTKIESDRNALQQSRYALLQAIGIDPNTQVNFSVINVPQLIKKYHIPGLSETKSQMIQHDIGYQVAIITLEGSTKRSVLSAEDKTRWQLDLTVNSNAGGSSGGGPNAGINSLVNGVNQTNSAMLSLTIPIDDHSARVAVASAKIALHEATIALQQQKWNKETNAINNWNSIFSAKRSLEFAEQAEKLQAKTYQINFQKYSHGLIDSLELQTAQQQYVASQQTLENARTSYLKSLIDLDQMIGNTLTTWDVKVRYD